jgi:hypothetical protein
VEVVEGRGGDGRVLVFAVRNPAGRVGELGGFGQPGDAFVGLRSSGMNVLRSGVSARC